MKEKTFNYTLRYYLFQLGRVKTLTVFSCLFGVLGFPLLCIGNVLMNTREMDNITVPMLIISYISMLGMALLSFITPVAVLKHLYTKTNADNILSLPLTATQRFIGDIGAILTSYCLPMLMSALLSFAGEKITVALLDITLWGADDNYYRYAFITFIATFEFIALNTAITTLCGRMAEAVLYPFAINIALPLTIILGSMIAFTDCYGIYNDTAEVMNSVICLMFPFTLLFNIFSMSRLVTGGLIFSAVYFALAYFGYTKRRAQNIGKPFVFRYSYLITSTLVGLCFIVCYTFLSDIAPLRGDNIAVSILTVGIVLLILMLVMEVINYRKVHSLPKFSLHFASTLGGGLLICFLLLISRGFGAGYYVPKAQKVENASIHGYYYNKDWESGIANFISYSEGEAIDAIIEEHQLLVDNYDYNEMMNESGLQDTVYNTSIDYHMKNGTDVSRSYSSDLTTPLLWERLFSSESYRLNSLTSLKGWRGIPIGREAEIRLVNCFSDKIYMAFIQKNLFESDLYKALEADLKADTEYGRHNESPVGILRIGNVSSRTRGTEQYDDFGSYSHVVIYESYTNTIEFLSKYGTVPTATESTLDSTKGSEVFMLYRRKTGGIDVPAEEIIGDYSGSSAIFITADEFRDLTSKQVEYNNFDGDDEYVYYLCPGLWNMMFDASKQDIINALEKDGMAVANYDFLEINKHYGYYDKMMINTEYNDICDSLFEIRTEFVYNLTEYGEMVTVR